MDRVITTRDLRKNFRTRKGSVEAVRGVSIDGGRGEIFGFLGPNGAGKTTLAYELAACFEGVLVDLDWASGGAAKMWGHDPRAVQASVAVGRVRAGSRWSAT